MVTDEEIKEMENGEKSHIKKERMIKRWGILGIIIIIVVVVGISVPNKKKSNNNVGSLAMTEDDSEKLKPENIDTNESLTMTEDDSEELEPENIDTNESFFQQKKFTISLPEFDHEILDGYSDCNNLVNDVEEALADLANILIKDNMSNSQPIYSVAMDMGMQESAPMADTIETSSTLKSSGEDSFGTNNQHENVDEADIIKSDGSYVYAVYGSEIVVLDLEGNERYRLKIVADPSEPENSFYYIPFQSITGLLLHENRLVAIVSGYNYFYKSVSSSTTEIVIVDIDLTNGTLSITERKSVNGDYQAARMIDSNAHVITTSYIQTWDFLYDIQRYNYAYEGMNNTEYAESAFDMAASIIPQYANVLVRELVSSDIPLENDKDSPNHLNVAPGTCQHIAKISTYQNGKSDDDDDLTGLQGILNGFVRVTSFDIPSGLNDSSSVSAAFVPTAYADVYVSQDKLFLGGRGWGATSDAKFRDVTYITVFELSGASAIPKATGAVPGYTINQFSFDFFDNHLRIATTTSAVQVWDADRQTLDEISESTNQVIVAAIEDSEIKIVGTLEGLGETEIIYAVRFLGNRAFMVTFRQTDPFYAIDMSIPESPILKGELKIPGFSNYLHPVDDDYILAIGQDADEFGRTLGLQVALFDVSDLNNPQQIAKYVVKGWSYSESQYDHHAFRYLPLTRKLILPISSYSQRYSFDGFNVFDINPYFDKGLEENGIELDFVVSHFDSDQSHLGCYGNAYLKPRSLVFQGDMMTLKGHTILRHDVESGDALFKTDLDLNLNGTDNCYGWFF